MVIPDYRTACYALKDASELPGQAGKAALEKVAVQLGKGLDELSVKCNNLSEALNGLHEEIITAMNSLRATVDALELIVSDEAWPLPKYREMLFIY